MKQREIPSAFFKLTAMKSIFCILTFLFTGLMNGQQIFNSFVIEGLKDSELRITGKTNVNSFSCKFNTDYLRPCQNISIQGNEDEILFKNALLILKAKGFDCGSGGINNDFQKLLKTNEYPQIILELKKAVFTANEILATVAISMAGKKREYEVPVLFGQHHFKGILQLKLSDYELSLPKKLFGLIAVKDQIVISFDVVAYKASDKYYQFQNEDS